MTPSDTLWYKEKSENGWVMPAATWWKRLPVICRIRGVFALSKVEKHANEWASMGIGLGQPRQFDKWVCYGIAMGREQPLA